MAGFSSGTARTFFSCISQLNIRQPLKNANTTKKLRTLTCKECQILNVESGKPKHDSRKAYLGDKILKFIHEIADERS
jgi:hypothetical protein